MTSDEQAIANLINTAAARTDDGDFAAVGALFTEASFAVAGGPRVTGSDEVTALQSGSVALHDDGTPRTHHVVSNLSIWVDDDSRTARAESRFTAFQATEKLPLQPIATGAYIDEFVHDAGEWRFASRLVRTVLAGDLSQYLI